MMGKWLEIACFRTSVFPIRVVFPCFSRKNNRATFSPESEPYPPCDSWYTLTNSRSQVHLRMRRLCLDWRIDNRFYMLHYIYFAHTSSTRKLHLKTHLEMVICDVNQLEVDFRVQNYHRFSLDQHFHPEPLVYPYHDISTPISNCAAALALASCNLICRRFSPRIPWPTTTSSSYRRLNSSQGLNWLLIFKWVKPPNAGEDRLAEEGDPGPENFLGSYVYKVNQEFL